MGELTIRGNKFLPAPQYQGAAKAEKQSGGGQVSKSGGTAGFSISETLRQLMNGAGRPEGQIRENRRMLQTGESALAEVRDSLDRIAELMKQAGGEGADLAALQAELERLLETIDRMAGSAVVEGMPLFSDGGADDSALSRLIALYLEAVIAGKASPELEELLLLLSDGSIPAGPSLLPLLSGLQDMSPELLTGLLPDGQSAAPAPAEAGDAALPDRPEAPAAPAQPPRPAEAPKAQPPLPGRVSPGPKGELTLRGTADAAVQGTEHGPQSVVLAGSGRVTLRQADLSTLDAVFSETRVFTEEANSANTLRLREGAALTLDGTGRLKISSLRAGASSLLRLTGGAVIVEPEPGRAPAALKVPVIVDGPVSFAARAERVTDPEGTPLEPFDIAWKTLLPGWSSITAIEAGGKQAKMLLLNGEPARLWLSKGDHGYPVHALVIQGRDEAGRPRTRYAYLHWKQQAKAFQERAMYPNPFVITGGEAGRDWVYEERSHTLRILSAQVTVLSGGNGTDGDQTPFSGRIALADNIGAVELALDGVVCRVAAGRAFHLGRGNHVTLILPEGANSFFESGPGCAGVSLGDGTSLRIDASRDDGPAGGLTASGGAGGSGIGRDSGAGQDQNSHILILGGVITAAGGGGGAGIGGALDAAIGNISIQGGLVTASASGCAAAIGAGARGECGDIMIAGTARILKAAGGVPGADIGASLLGGCGQILVSKDADIGDARLWARTGLLLNIDGDTVILPQFSLSARALGLRGLSLATPEGVVAAGAAIEAARRRTDRIQAAYRSLYCQMEYSRIRCGDPVRDSGAACTLLEGVRQSIPQARRPQGKAGPEDVRRLLR